MTTSTRVFVASLGLLAVGSTASAVDVTRALTFVGITPCRIIETRLGQGFSGANGPPALVANANRTFQITGTVTGIPTQCGIPTTASAIAVNFVVVNFAGAGDIRAFPAGGALPNAAVLNYALETIGNANIVPLGPSGAGENGITVRADNNGTDFIADVSGYFIPRTPGVCGTNDVSLGGHCYYLDGTQGRCLPGYEVVSQSVLSTIAPNFVGLNYKTTISNNCCIYNADAVENWGMAAHCNTNGPFTAGDPQAGAIGCTGATNFLSAQLTLCGK